MSTVFETHTRFNSFKVKVCTCSGVNTRGSIQGSIFSRGLIKSLKYFAFSYISGHYIYGILTSKLPKTLTHLCLKLYYKLIDNLASLIFEAPKLS